MFRGIIRLNVGFSRFHNYASRFAVSTDREYTITTKTATGPSSGTDDDVYLTMYDSADNACIETELDGPGNDFKSRA